MLTHVNGCPEQSQQLVDHSGHILSPRCAPTNVAGT
jgi:hypothetical protein